MYEINNQNFGIEIEMTGLTRKKAAEIAAEFFRSRATQIGGNYKAWGANDNQGRTWKFVSDNSIEIERKEGQISEAVEMVSPICGYNDIPIIQELIRKLRSAGAVSNNSCGIHIHINAAPYTGRTLRNLTNIMASKQEMIYKALDIATTRANRWCKRVDQRFLQEINKRKPESLDEVKNIWYNGQDGSNQHYHNSRYVGLNLHSVFQKGTVEFRLFNSDIRHAGKIKAYIQFCLAISAQALNQKSANPKPTVTTNEKYTFRCWLLRLGMIGSEFKTARLHLMGNLEGNSAWRDPSHAEAQRERAQSAA